MAKANVILLNSILWNLREISKLADLIKKHCGDVDCFSWRYPYIRCSELEIFKLLQNNKNLDNYTYILELTYDRLLYVLNLIIKYMESNNALEIFRPERNVRRPKTLSLATVLCMIWERIRSIMENTSHNNDAVEESFTKEKIDVKVSKSTIYTQSEVCSISVCSCCEMVQEFVTQLILDLEKNVEKVDTESAISAERKVMRQMLVEVTNWSAMSRWLTAIVKDFNTLSEKSEQEVLSSRKLKSRLSRVDADEKKMKTRIEQFEEETRSMGIRIHEYESKVSELKEQVEKLSKDKIKLKENVKQKNADLAKLTLDFETKIDEMKKQHETKLQLLLAKKAKKNSEKEKEWRKKLNWVVKRREKLEIEIKVHLDAISKIQEDLDRTNIEKSDLVVRCTNLEVEIENFKRENSNLNLKIKEKQNIIEDYSKRFMEAFPSLTGDSEAAFKASGNPQIDMENQIEANNLRIQRMKDENENLRRTLNKIKTLKGC